MMVVVNVHTHSTTPAGWREWVRLPGVENQWLKAKLDTGARSSSLHAEDLEIYQQDGVERVRCRVRPWQASDLDIRDLDLPVHDHRSVRSSNGQVEDRIVVLLDIELLGRIIPAEVTLTNRDLMGFRMLIGRQALRQGFLVDSSRSYLSERAPRELRRRNRGLA